MYPIYLFFCTHCSNTTISTTLVYGAVPLQHHSPLLPSLFPPSRLTSQGRLVSPLHVLVVPHSPQLNNPHARRHKNFVAQLQLVTSAATAHVSYNPREYWELRGLGGALLGRKGMGCISVMGQIIRQGLSSAALPAMQCDNKQLIHYNEM